MKKSAKYSPAAAEPMLRRLVLFNVLLALLVASLTALTLYRRYQDHREQAEAATRNMAQVLEQHLATVIDKADMSLRTVALEVERQGARGGIKAEELNRFIAGQQSLLPELVSLRIAGVDGGVRFGGGEGAPNPINVADHAYFIRVRDNPRAGLVIDGPVMSPLNGKWTVILARRLNRPDGSFAGVVYAGIASEYFLSMLARLSQGPQWLLCLRSGDLRLIARHPWNEEAAAIGSDQLPSPLRQALQADPRQGSFSVAMSPMDGAGRIISYIRLAQYPLYVTAGLDTAKDWSDWRREALGESALAALVILVALTASSLLDRSWKRQDRMRRTLQLLNDSNTALLHAESEEQLLPGICRLIVETGGYRMAWVGMAETDAGKTVRPAAYFGESGDSGDFLDGIKVSWADVEQGSGPTGTAIRTGRTQVIQNILGCTRVKPWCEALCQRGYRSGIGLPLIIDGIVMGSLTLYAAESEAFGAEEIGLLETLADNLAFGIAGVRTRQQLYSTVQELQAFTYAASHDLKSPLRGIHSFSGLLEQRCRDQLDGDGRMFLGHVRRNVTRMMSLIDDLLAYSRIEHDTRLPRSVDLPATVGAIVAELQGEIRQCGAEVKLDLPAAKVQADPIGLAQVLRNLLGNALKYAARGNAPLIEIGGAEADGRCRLWVRDNGIGFDMDYGERIFEVFRRLHTYDEYPGSGVGLALVRKAMQRMGGRVWADSTPGQGATFYLELRSAACAIADQAA